MICPSCKREIADGSIICPICNTQFAFTVPGLTQTSNPSLYEVVEKPTVVDESLEESAYSPVETVLPTEIDHYPEEEINPDANALKYANMVDDSQEEYMTIYGREITNEPYTPDSAVTTPIRPEAPMGVSVVEPVVSPVVDEPQSVNVQNQAPLSNVMPQDNSQPMMQTVVTAPTQESKKKKISNEDLFFGGVSVVGLIVLVIIVVSLFTKNNGNQKVAYQNKGNVYEQTILQTDNVGNRSTFNAPMKIGDTTLASIYDTINQAYVDVDVTGLRFIDGTEAAELAKIYAKEELNEGFAWYGFEYRVKFNDLKSLTGKGISPVLNSKVYRWNGCDFVTFNEKNYSIKPYNIYTGGTIANTQTANIKVVYQMPPTETDYSVCFGYLEKTLGCFSKKSILG